VFENRVLSRIFGPRRDEATGEWRKLHNEELHDLYSSPSIIRIMKSRKMRWAGHVARMGLKRNGYTFLVGKPEGRRPLGRPRIRWADNIREIFLAPTGNHLQFWKLWYNNHGAYAKRLTPTFYEEDIPPLSNYMFRGEHEVVHRTRRDLKPRITVLMRASS
jgi:hypothetical protein